VTPDALDSGFVAAVRAAAASAAPEPEDRSFLEKRLAAAVGAAVAREFAPLRVTLNKKLADVTLDEWDPQPGSFDVALLREDGLPLAVAELKLDDVDQTLWDILKVASALRLGSVEAAYVVAAAPEPVWASTMEVVEVFRQAEEEEWSTRFLLEEYRKAWESLLRGGRGRPTTPPLKVEPNELLDDELTPAHLPASDSDELAIHEFALTTNGYERMGSSRRLAELANNAIEQWQTRGELPATLRELRCCLFFEQRRWHHYGYGFDDEALEYVRALIAAMRPLVEANQQASATRRANGGDASGS
jgi:hypothetical protein